MLGTPAEAIRLVLRFAIHDPCTLQESTCAPRDHILTAISHSYVTASRAPLPLITPRSTPMCCCGADIIRFE